MFLHMNDRAVIKWDILTKSDLHIGGHGTSGPADVDLPVLRNSEDFPIIPGSSLKGVLRTELERLLRGGGFEVCTIPDVCYSSRWLRNHPERRNMPIDPCLVCQLFGSGGNCASVRIRDLTANKRGTVIRDGVAIDRKTRKAQGSAKYDLEAVPKGTVFSGEVTIDNCSLKGQNYARLGGLLSLVSFFNACAGTIGHSVSRGYGEVEIRIHEIKIITATDYLNGAYSGNSYQAGTDEYEHLCSQAQAAWRACMAGLNR